MYQPIVFNVRTCHVPYIMYIISLWFLNQVRAGHRPERAWFLKIDPVRIVGMHACVCVCVCVCVCPRAEAINN